MRYRCVFFAQCGYVVFLRRAKSNYINSHVHAFLQELKLLKEYDLLNSNGENL